MLQIVDQRGHPCRFGHRQGVHLPLVYASFLDRWSKHVDASLLREFFLLYSLLGICLMMNELFEELDEALHYLDILLHPFIFEAFIDLVGS